MAEVSSAYMSIMPSAKGFGRSLESQVNGEVGTAGKGIGGKFGTALKVGAVAAVGGAVIAGAFLKSSLGEAREAQKIAAQTNAVIKSTGGIAGVTAEQISKLAGAISMKTGIDDEAIQSGANLLLTFKGIRNEAGAGNDIFDQTTKTLVDMSAAMGTEPKQAAIQLGKALNDPIKGISALSRVGVTFTEGQKKVIEGMVDAGNVMGAQKIILKELNSEFGGSAEAQATAGDKLRVAWGNFQETVGTALLPLWDRLLNGMTQVTLYMTSQVGPAFAKVSAFVTPLVAQVQAAFGGGAGGGGLMVGIKSVGDYLTATLVPVFAQYVGILRNQVLPMAQSVASYYVGTFLPAMLAIWAVIAQKLRPVFEQLVDTYRTQLLPTASLVLAKFREWGPTIQKVAAVVVSLYGKWLIFQATIAGKVLPIVIRFIGFLVSNAVPAIIRNIEITAKFVGAVINLGQAVVDRIQDFAKFLKGVKDKFGDAVTFVESIPGKIKAALGDLSNMLYAAGRQIIEGLANGIIDKARDAAAAAADAAKSVANAAKGALGIRSPSKVFHQIGEWTMEGFANGITTAGPKALESMQSVLEKTIDQVTNFRDGIKSRLDGVKSDFASLRDSIASTFAGDPFNVSAIAESLTDTTFTAATTVGQSFLDGLRNKKGQLSDLLAAFKTLKGWGLPGQFLSQLFASGNSDLILELAAGRRGQAQSAASLFSDVQSLSNQLGTQVARDRDGAQIKRLENRLDRANGHLKNLDTLAKDLARALGQASASTQRRPA